MLEALVILLVVAGAVYWQHRDKRNYEAWLRRNR